MANIHMDILLRYDAILEAQGATVEWRPDPGTSLGHLRWMIQHLLNDFAQDEKAHRWLGFIQGIMVANGLITVTEERNFTRPYFTKER